MSCTKSLVNIAIGRLIDTGKIKSLDQPVHRVLSRVEAKQEEVDHDQAPVESHLMWNGKRIISEKWIEDSMKPGQPYEPLSGLLWWLKPGSKSYNNETDGFNDFIDLVRALAQ